jgi:uncharacterized protein YdeI (YjbR/CyaY-like superfamily)
MPGSTDEGEEPVAFPTADDWRSWLQANHAERSEVWLLIHKKASGKPSVTLEEAMKEAVCFGWVDSVLHPIDEGSYALRYTPRRKGSNWSERNKRWAIEAIADGRMTEAGLAAIEEARRGGTWGEDPA